VTFTKISLFIRLSQENDDGGFSFRPAGKFFAGEAGGLLRIGAR